ncbi:hypothetical protein BBOV_III000385 [Babesia bovis T2Bo]|uniref:hypothetical protein n=1 Tax=Babesia bovis T2Bo TaxID=484906 RepID=UPI001C3486ED|nr:hypothetical protein BBOV_III000385 [Babesia bovis T2Bo]KAG6440020.1 hypothetical protein BBOV_III000385 [Babesia bovis T2Bo]
MKHITFLGTPLSKYEIDDIETDLLNKRAKEFEKTKGLQYRQNREKIKRNDIVTHYTVDTKEGFVPANFKSSKSSRALYTHQNVRSFTDVEDSDIIGKNTLKAININRVGLKRNIANILNAMGFMNKKRFIGPMNITAIHNKVSTTLEGVGFRIDDPTIPGNLQFIKSTSNDAKTHNSQSAILDTNKCDDSEAQSSMHKDENQNMSFSRSGDENATHKLTKHVDDREFDLGEIKYYYQHLYGYIVNVMDKKDDFLDKISEGLDFTSKSVMSQKAVKRGRNVEIYTFDNELLQRFNIKSSRGADEMGVKSVDLPATNEINAGKMLPAELFRRIFGN